MQAKLPCVLRAILKTACLELSERTERTSIRGKISPSPLPPRTGKTWFHFTLHEVPELRVNYSLLGGRANVLFRRSECGALFCVGLKATLWQIGGISFP